MNPKFFWDYRNLWEEVFAQLGPLSSDDFWPNCLGASHE